MRDLIIIGGSFAGLSAALTVLRMRFNVLMVDSGLRCNQMITESHGFLAHDGDNPGELQERARSQLFKYPTFNFVPGKAISAKKNGPFFEVTLEDNQRFESRRILFATGKKDILPEIPGFVDCWGYSIQHCPFCHGYELRDKKLALLDNGPTLLTICSFLLKLTNSLTILTNGAACSLSEETKQMLLNHPTAKVMIVEDEIQAIDHKDRQIHHITFKAEGRPPLELDALYAPCPTVQHCTIPMELGCELVEPHQRLKIDQNFQTTVPGVYAAGDCESMIRQVSLAVASGAQAGGLIAMSLAAEDMNQNNI